MSRQLFPDTTDSVRDSNSLAFSNGTGTGWLGWRSWLVLFGLGTAVVLIEWRNHTLMWQQHGSGQTIWTDGELLWESLLYLLVFPLLGGLALKYIARRSGTGPACRGADGPPPSGHPDE